MSNLVKSWSMTWGLRFNRLSVLWGAHVHLHCGPHGCICSECCTGYYDAKENPCAVL